MSPSRTNSRKDPKTKKGRRTKAAKKPAEKAAVTHRDLCSTCAASPHCIHRTVGMPVYHCDEYEIQPALADPVVAPVVTPPETSKLMGLCVDCKHRDNCSLSAREGGVWHCEEYC